MREAGDRLRVVVNADHDRGGQSSSLRVGLAALRRAAASPTFGSGIGRRRLNGVVFVNCDQPLLRADHINALVARLEAAQGPGSRPAADAAIVVPVHDGHRGHPVLFGRGFFDELTQVMGDEGGRSVIRRHPEAVIEVASDEAVLADADSPDDIQRLKERARREGLD
ncbi:MAG: nucleotidyltransferase family protein, partial [Bacillota bacterium]